MKKWIATAWLTFLLALIFSFFWYNQFVYSLPTPVPLHYKAVLKGEKIPLGSKLHFNNRMPVFLHFFNPDCPCSRFNITHFKSLVRAYRNRANFAVVLQTGKHYSAEEISQRFGLDIPIITDTALAAKCGVYSTPQAVIINADDELYYRGNYNKTRYCTDARTSYAKIALDGVLQGNNKLLLDPFASKAYGCTLPNCSK